MRSGVKIPSAGKGWHFWSPIPYFFSTTSHHLTPLLSVVIQRRRPHLPRPRPAASTLTAAADKPAQRCAPATPGAFDCSHPTPSAAALPQAQNVLKLLSSAPFAALLHQLQDRRPPLHQPAASPWVYSNRSLCLPLYFLNSCDLVLLYDLISLVRDLCLFC